MEPVWPGTMPASRFGGGRSTEAVGFGATAYGRRIWWVCSASGSVLSVLIGSDASGSGCGHGSAMAGGNVLAGSAVKLVRALRRKVEERGMMSVLTVNLQSRPVGSGRR